jgi:high-affinity Fe2+/Pb2+ permease
MPALGKSRQLDGKSDVAVFLGSLFIILMDGFEAILIVTALYP